MDQHVQVGSAYPSDGGEATENKAKITVLTHRSFIGKRFDLAPDGTLAKSSQATFFDGTARVVDAPDAPTLTAILTSMTSRDVISLGRLKRRKTSSDIKSAKRAGEDDATRTLEHFEHAAGPGWLLLDHDAKGMPGDVFARVADLGGGVAAIESIWPELARAERVFKPSSSGGVHLEGADPADATGFHLFTLVEDARQSKDILDELMRRAWAAGLAWHIISKSGALLPRSIIDASVGTPERLVFTAPPELGPGVYRTASEMVVKRGKALAMPSGTTTGTWRRAEQESRRRLKPEAEAIEAEHIDRQAEKVALKTGKTKAESVSIVRSRVEGRILHDDDVLVAGGGSARVGDVLDRYFTVAGSPKIALPDPLEPEDYPTGAAIMWQTGFAEPVLISQAHGIQTKYRFARHMDDDATASHMAQRAQERAQERGEVPAPADLPDGKRGTLEAAMSAAGDRDEAMAVAMAVVAGRIKRTPHMWSEVELLAYILEHLPDDVLDDADVEMLKATIGRRNKARRRAALGFTEIGRSAMHWLVAGGAVRCIDDLSEADPTLDGATILKASMGTGKTQKVGAPWVAEARKHRTVMAICHRVSLVSEMSTRLDLPHYQKASPEDILDAGGVAVCLPSITARMVSEVMPQPDFVFIDEVAQVLRFLESKDTCSTSMADAEGVFDALVRIIRNAKAVLVADAGIDTRTVDFLRHCRPNERLELVKMDPQPVQKTARVYASADPGGQTTKARVLDHVLMEIASGGKVFVACESRNMAEDLARVLEADGHNVLAVTATNKDGERQSAFLANADAASRLYDAVVVSPAVVSGISIEHKDAPHFTLGAFIGAGQTMVPADAMQQIARVRYLTRFVIGLGSNNRADGQTSLAILSGSLDLADMEDVAAVVSTYDSLRAGVQAQERNAQADFAAGLFWMLEDAGWTLERHGSAGAASGDALAIARDMRIDEWMALVMGAEVPDPATADMLRRRRLEPRDAARLEAFDIYTTLAVAEVDGTAFELWDEGNAKRRIERFEDLLDVGVLPMVQDARIIARDFRQGRRALLRQLFDGIDLTEEHPFTPEVQEVFLDRVMARREALVAAGILPERFRSTYRWKGREPKTPPRPKHFKRVLSDIAEQLGLRVAEVRKRLSQNSPSLYKDIQSEGVLGQQDNRTRVYGIDPASWQKMQDILTRRAVAGPVPKMSENPPPEPEEAVVAPYKKDPDPAELDFARAHKRAEVAEPKREAVRQEVLIARRSAAAQVARAIAGGATKPKDIQSQTGLPPEKAGTALRRMQEAGLVYELRPGRFGLTFDLAELESRQGPEQTHLVIGPGSTVPEVRPAPDRCFVVLPPSEQLATWLMAHRHSLDGGRRYAVA